MFSHELHSTTKLYKEFEYSNFVGLKSKLDLWDVPFLSAACSNGVTHLIGSISFVYHQTPLFHFIHMKGSSQLEEVISVQLTKFCPKFCPKMKISIFFDCRFNTVYALLKLSFGYVIFTLSHYKIYINIAIYRKPSFKFSLLSSLFKKLQNRI